jgi:hypothetical protein
MGESTPHLNLYKPEGSELVDVVAHLNENYDKIDSGTLGLDSRLETVEGLAEISAGWVEWEPAIKFGSPELVTWQSGSVVFAENSSVLTPTSSDCSYFKLGDLITCIIEVKGDWGAVTAAKGMTFMFKLPYETLDNSAGGTASLDMDLTYVPYLPFTMPNADDTHMMFCRQLVNTALTPDNMEVNLGATDAAVYLDTPTRFRAFFSYRTNGVEVP